MERFKPLIISSAILVAGALLFVLTSASVLRFPKAEAAAYLFTAIGLVATCVSAVRALRYVRPEPGCVVSFWGPDGRTKLTGRITGSQAGGFVVETQSGSLVVPEASFLSVRRGQ